MGRRRRIDKVAEDVALRLLKQSKIPVNLCSEEIGVGGLRWGVYVRVGPGGWDAERVSRDPVFFGVASGGSVASSDCEFGVVRNIPTGDVFMAEQGKGAFLNGVAIRACDVPSKDMVSSVSLGRGATRHAAALAAAAESSVVGGGVVGDVSGGEWCVGLLLWWVGRGCGWWISRRGR